ncbi:hypothetical protein K3495_g1758 [Podosphaera aphanis]|nr:hypothetical protein K3495_g1758 [Podosphaera aphanis]
MPRHGNPKNAVAAKKSAKNSKKQSLNTKSSADFSLPRLALSDDSNEKTWASLPKTIPSQADKKNKKKRKHEIENENEPTRSENDESESKRLRSGHSPLQKSVSPLPLMGEKKRKKQDKSSIELHLASSKPNKPRSTKSKAPNQFSKTSSSKDVTHTKPRPEHSNIRNLESNEDVSEDENSVIEKIVPYQQLKAVTKKISRARIEEKWSALPPSCVDHISHLLQDVERSAIASLNDDRKKQASLTVQAISRKISSKVSKGLPFPRSSRKNRDDDFDFEKILNHSRSLENQLTPALHANKLLGLELKKEQEYLKLEEDKLTELRTNAKKELVLRNETTKKFHPILQENHIKDDFDFEDVGLESISEERDCPLIFNVHDTGKVATLAKEIHGHVVSLHNNIKQVDCVREAILRGKAALQANLFNHLTDEEYNDVVFGLE